MLDPTTDILLKVPASHAVVQASGKKVQIFDSKIFTTCPECSSRMWIHGNSFLCENSVCNLKCCNPIEYLSACNHSYSLEKAIPSFLSIVDPKNKIPVNDESLCSDLVKRRKILQVVINSYKEEHQSFDDITVSGWLRLQGIDVNNIKSVAVVWNQDKLDQYIKLTQGFKLKSIPSCPYYIVVPYMASYGAIGGLMFIAPEMESPVMHVFLNKKYLWAGLLGECKIKKEYLVTSSFSNLIELASSNKMFITDQIPILSMYHNPAAFDYDFMPDSIHYLYDAKSDIFGSNMASLSFDCPNFKIGSINTCPTSGQAYSWDEFLIKYVIYSANKSGLSSPLISFLDSAQLTASQEYSILNSLSVNGFSKEYNQLKQHFANKVIHLADNVCVTQKSDGYVMSSGKVNKKLSSITNFTLNVIRNVAFPDQKKVLSETDVSFKEKEFKVWLSVEGLESANSVEEAVRTAWITCEASEGSSDSIPIITNKIDYRKYVAPYTRGIASRCPYTQGVSFLGWDFKKTMFRGPGWFIDANGLHFDDSLLYPDSDYLTCYGNKAVELKDGTDLTDSTRRSIAIVLGLICRSFFDKITPGLKIDSVDNTEMTRLLKTLGQTKYFGPDSRDAKISHNNGFPVGVINTSEFYRNKAISPVIDLDRNSNSVLVGEDCGYLFYVLSAVVNSVIKGLVNYPESMNSSDRKNTLMREGLHYIEMVIGEKWNIAVTEDDYDKLFRVFSKEQLTKNFQINPSKGIVVYKNPSLKLPISNKVEPDGTVVFPMQEFTSKAYTFYEDNSIDFDFELT